MASPSSAHAAAAAPVAAAADGPSTTTAVHNAASSQEDAAVAALVPVAAYLRDAGACAGCVLRCLGLHTAPHLLAAEQTLADKLHVNVPPRPLCVYCEGLLVSIQHEAFRTHTIAATRASGFKFHEVQLMLCTPLSLQLRHHALLLSLRKHFPEHYGPGSKLAEVPTAKECMKVVLHHLLPTWIGAPHNIKSAFRISMTFENKETLPTLELMLALGHKRPRKQRRREPHVAEVTAPMMTSVLESVSEEDFKRVVGCPPSPPPSPFPLPTLVFAHDSIFLAGRYLKFSRELSQTPWVIDGERKTEHSVQDLLLNPITKRVQADEARFSSAGREDVDVRMLGTGRPFIFELVNPRVRDLSKELLQEMQDEVNASTTLVGMRDLQLVDKDETAILKEGEETKTKTYSCVVWTERDFSTCTEELAQRLAIKDLSVQQKTPVRVMHRRALAVRPKTIHGIKFEVLQPHFLRLWLSTQAGTYIKEFVHGDFGRSSPNLSTLLGCPADILSLDVEAINLDWPPAL